MRLLERRNLTKIYNEAASLWMPPEDLTVDEWADKYRRLPGGLSAEGGQWRTDRTPYMREPMRAFCDPLVEEIVFVAPSQVGKSELELNIIAYIIDQDPGTILYVQPRKEDAQSFSRLRIAPMLKACDKIRDKVHEVDKKGRAATSTVLQKAFPGGMLTLVGSSSASDLSSQPVRYVIGDELDRFSASAGRDGDPWELAKRRQNTFYNRKRVAVSTPTVKGASQIEFLYTQGTRERWKTRCPECGEYSEVRFDDIKFNAASRRIVGKVDWVVDVTGWKCPCCGTIIPEQDVKKSDARWEAENPDAIRNNRCRSFWLGGFSSPWRPWKDIIQNFCKAKGDAELLPGRIENIRWVFPEAPIHLIDDSANPIPSELSESLAAPNVFYEQSGFPRFGNLNGYHCIRGMLDVYAKHLRMDESAIKTDADALFLNKDELRKIAASGLGFAAVHVANYIYGGYFYMMRADVLSLVCQWLPQPRAVFQGAHEDVTIGCLAYACATMLNYPCDFLTDSRFGGLTGAFAHRFTGDERDAYICKQLDQKAIMMTLGNPGITKNQCFEAQQDVLTHIRSRENTPPATDPVNDEKREEEDNGAV